MKKYIVFIVIFIAGLALGYIFFGNQSTAAEDGHDHAGEQADQMWTCSMHPQIMQPEPGACPICGMDLIPADAAADGLAANQFKMTSNAMALANIQTAVVGEVNADGMLRLSGKIKESEKANATQTVHFSGRIEKLYVNFTGEQVKRGQLLALIYSPELLSAQQELITAAKLKESQPQLYKAVKNKLKFWKLSDKQIEDIAASGKVKENIPVYANASGVVTEKMVEEGDYVKQGQVLYKVSDLGTVWAEFDAYENQIASLKKGQTITIRTKAYPNEEFEAKVSFIDPVLNSTTRTVTVRADLRNKNGLFKPGMFVEGAFEGVEQSGKSFISVPKSAVLWTGKRSLVYVKAGKDEPVFEMREVTIGSTSGDSYVITKGLEFGDEVVINGTFTVDAAAQLQGKKSMMNHEDGMSMEMTLTTGFQEDFMPVMEAYLKLKDVLVASNAGQAQGEAKNALGALSDIKTASLGKMEQQHVDVIRKMLETVSNSKDLETQRSHFKILSENMIAMVSNFQELQDTLYVQYCPMADSNQGAYWLSKEDKVLNPYYGDAMLSCGEVTKTIQ
ncbi:membrane fusion protein, Cu(I)/Ag(I) efflux system [Zhouia amylolytica]|uniref:Efflux transporter, RND family, MFP subunit n=2 Tax=Zhouia amylolytica TaxID=376730 RepID=W2UIE6_9FLAO|nr:efflux RND transporter periplasmic adaptor subunit [Zhouia amylolytica]ETN93758.1 efflux transporter, RND family, MFP subunit [Zhouia amylolytica AD3]MCQ0111793.1 efflux RND transporter periplasmic adaptor subunit [Zhouia amylolytica]SFS36228.1 membrane fusion protein, Cu(I)/Ag(I) efflux system [Zhouia amylolytica]